MKQKHGNLRVMVDSMAFAPLPWVARATSPTRWATSPAEDREHRFSTAAPVSGEAVPFWLGNTRAPRVPTGTPTVRIRLGFISTLFNSIMGPYFSGVNILWQSAQVYDPQQCGNIWQ